MSSTFHVVTIVRNNVVLGNGALFVNSQRAAEIEFRQTCDLWNYENHMSDKELSDAVGARSYTTPDGLTINLFECI
jgi:hypothetical protein